MSWEQMGTTSCGSGRLDIDVESSIAQLLHSGIYGHYGRMFGEIPQPEHLLVMRGESCIHAGKS
jgi:hypothetical protein